MNKIQAVQKAVENLKESTKAFENYTPTNGQKYKVDAACDNCGHIKWSGPEDKCPCWDEDPFFCDSCGEMAEYYIRKAEEPIELSDLRAKKLRAEDHLRHLAFEVIEHVPDLFLAVAAYLDEVKCEQEDTDPKSGSYKVNEGKIKYLQNALKPFKLTTDEQ